MKKIYCDRCGKEITPEESYFICGYAKGNDTTDDYCVDLCDDCYKKIRKFAGKEE